MNVHNAKEGHVEEMKVMHELYMQMKKPCLNILMMLKGEKP